MDKNYTFEDITQLSKDIIKHVPHKVLLFYGDMGVGKTTLIKQLCKELGSNDIISSPTFSLVNEYTSKSSTIYHFDFYRINNEEEALDIGIEDYLYSNNWCFIEWPENIENLLPLDAVEIHLTLLEDGSRNIKIN
ncbi:MAG: tRNA (adenosine(37)-N6)-threonylcarbamoyltransferase complex ATPase subunit type 1 TsaE [Polaribacter sp.]|jgi:tRNA threonylcarbamoyladenosine biosynthesis protein TsaE